MTTSLQPTVTVAAPILYRDEWVRRTRGNPYPDSLGLTLCHKAWPARAVQTDFGLTQQGTLGPALFLVRWFSTVDGRVLAETWEAVEQLELAREPGLPSVRDHFQVLGRAAALALRVAEVAHGAA